MQQKIKEKMDSFSSSLKEKFNKIASAVKERDVKAAVKSSAQGALGAVKGLASRIAAFFKEMPKKKLVCNHVAPVIALAVLIITVAYCSSLSFGLSVTYAGEHIATVDSEGVIEKANELFNNKLMEPTDSLAFNLSYEVTEVSASTVESSPYKIADKMLVADSEVQDGVYGVYVDGDFVGAVESSDGVQSLINGNIAAEKAKYGSDTEIEYLNEFKFLNGVYQKNLIKTPEQIIDGVKDKLSLAVVRYETEEISIDYDVIYQTDDSMYSSETRTLTYGEYGVKERTYKRHYINNELVSEEAVSEEIVSQPVNKVVARGTKRVEPPTGSFIWPVPYTRYITSPFGDRPEGYHRGIDISDSCIYGASVVASDGGTVTWSGYDTSGYGYYVIIDHGNGFSTLYGHCSDLYVSCGDVVSQGQTIAAVGNSGYSTGAHLHFEIRCGGSYLDPQSYV